MSTVKIYDISQEVFGCVVFPGDPAPQKQTLNSMAEGSLYNLTALSMCAHNGTHIDAPFHFINDGLTVDKLPLSSTVGWAFVAQTTGTLTSQDAENILAKAALLSPEAAKRILLKGKITVSFEAAQIFAAAKVALIGNESQTVGPENAPMEVHKVLLSADVVLLEGIRLQDIPEGVYWLNAAPLSLKDADGAPCRATLVQF